MGAVLCNLHLRTKFYLKNEMLVFAVLLAVAAANLLPGDEGYDEHDHDHHHHHDHEHEHHEHEHHEHEHHHHETSENAQPIAIVKSASESDPNTGKYSFSFETENGISVSENGEQKRYGDKPEEVSNVARGSYSFPHDGVTYTITWYADETGYHAEGAHLPTVPVV